MSAPMLGASLSCCRLSSYVNTATASDAPLPPPPPLLLLPLLDFLFVPDLGLAANTAAKAAAAAAEVAEGAAVGAAAVAGRGGSGADFLFERAPTLPAEVVGRL